jgi:hypothetical protein
MQTGIGGGDHEEHTIKPCFRVSDFKVSFVCLEGILPTKDFSKFLVVISVY